MWGVIRQRATIFGGVPVSPRLPLTSGSPLTRGSSGGNAFSSSISVGLGGINRMCNMPDLPRRKRIFSFQRSILLNILCIFFDLHTYKMRAQQDRLRDNYRWNKKLIANEKVLLAREESLYKMIFANRAS